MTALKSEIYTMTSLILSKKFFCQSLKKRTSLIANCLINIFQKLNKDQKAPLWKFENTLAAPEVGYLLYIKNHNNFYYYIFVIQ